MEATYHAHHDQNDVQHDQPSPSPAEIQHHIFALFEAAWAPATSPTCNLPFTCAA